MLRFVTVPQYGFAKWTYEFGREERNCNHENFTKVTKTQAIFYTFGLASMGLVCADTSGDLLTSSDSDVEKKKNFSKHYQTIRTKATDALDEFLFDAEDSHGMNQEKISTPLMKLFAINFRKYWKKRGATAAAKLQSPNQN